MAQRAPVSTHSCASAADVHRRALLQLATAARATPAFSTCSTVCCSRVGVGQHDAVELRRCASLTSRACSVSRYRRIDAIGVFSSWVTALMKLSCCFVAPHLAHQKHGVDDEAGDDEREGHDAEDQRHHAPPVDMIQPMFSETAAATRSDAEDDEEAMAFWRRVIGAILRRLAGFPASG